MYKTHRHMNKVVLACSVCAQTIATSCYGQATEYYDRASWESTVGEFTTIGFTGFPLGFLITDEYADQGVLFTDGFDQVFCCGFFATYPQDGAGLSGLSQIELEFTQPMLWIAADFPGNIRISLYDGDDLIFSSISFGVGGPGNFGGLLSSIPFSRAVITDPTDAFVFIDDLHFGPSIPAPAAAPLFAATLLWGRHRRRR